MRVLEIRSHPDLSAESLQAQVRAQVWVQHLNDYGATERCVLGDENTTHSAAWKLTLDSVFVSECFLKLVFEIGQANILPLHGVGCL
jgi:hypothetical protein